MSARLSSPVSQRAPPTTIDPSAMTGSPRSRSCCTCSGRKLGSAIATSSWRRCEARGRATLMRASTTTARSGRPITGLRSSSASSGKSSASRESRWRMSASAAASAGGAPRNPATSLPALPERDELVRVDVRERREPEVGVADQLGHHSAGPEGDERAEDRVLRDAREQLDAALDLRLHDHGAADALGRGADGLGVGEVERDAARLRLVRAGQGGLDDDGEAELGCGAWPPRPASPRGARRRAGGRRRGAAGASRPDRARRLRRRRAPSATTSAAAAVSTSASRGTVPAERRSHSP